MPKMLLLDTHIWLWLVAGQQLTKKTVALLETAAAQNQINIAAISAWEVAMLAQKQRIQLDRPIEDWLDAAIATTNTNIIPLTPRIATVSCTLANLHGDPADRMIVATAKTEGMLLLTRDEQIINYCQEQKITHQKA